MLKIDCPYCGPRAEVEFRGGGEAHIARPTDPLDRTDEEWQAYLYLRDNPKGLIRERWNHAHGCQRWFNAIRNTVTDRFEMTYKVGERPEIEGRVR